MGFLAWHYSAGVEFYLKRYKGMFVWIVHYFSMPLLIKTLLSPWKRLIETDTSPGFNLRRWFDYASYNAVSRLMGAIVRLTLFIAGLALIILTAVFGAFGIIVWLLFPPLSYPIYKTFVSTPEAVVEKIVLSVNNSPEHAISTIFDSVPGQFVLAHTGLTLVDVTTDALKKNLTIKAHPKSFAELMAWLNGNGVWSETFFRKYGLKPDDLTRAGAWWDKRCSRKAVVNTVLSVSRPGVGLELLYGYTPHLNQYSTDLGAPQSFAHHLIGRQEVVSRMERVLSSGNSIVLAGAPGVGKKTVVYEFAHRAATGALGPSMVYKRLMELDYNFLFSETADKNKKKSEFSAILKEAEAAGNVILVIRDLHRLVNPAVEGIDLTDTLEGFLEKRELKIITIITDREYERYLAPNMRIRKFFETVNVKEPNKVEAMEILYEAAERWESLRGVATTVQALEEILEGSDRYITETPFPEKALELLDAAVLYAEQSHGKKLVDVDVVKEVLAEKVGVSFTKLTESERARLTNLEEIIHERLVNQETAVELIGKVIRSKSVGVVKTNRPLGSFLFLGPTGVGKTETAKVLSNVYYGDEAHMIRFDMAEYSGNEGLERLIGTSSSEKPGELTTAIKNKPASLLLLDEIEKAPPEVFNLFLTLLDEGYITDALGRKINCQHLFVIATTNAGSEHIRQLVSKGLNKDELQREVVNHVLTEGHFSPEFVNRFDGAIVYEPLSEEHLIKIAGMMLQEIAVNLKEQGIDVDFDDGAAVKLAKEGHEPAFGARPMRRTIELSLGGLLGKAVLSGELAEGDAIKVFPGDKRSEYYWEKQAATSAR